MIVLSIFFLNQMCLVNGRTFAWVLHRVSLGILLRSPALRGTNLFPSRTPSTMSKLQSLTCQRSTPTSKQEYQNRDALGGAISDWGDRVLIMNSLRGTLRTFAFSRSVSLSRSLPKAQGILRTSGMRHMNSRLTSVRRASTMSDASAYSGSLLLRLRNLLLGTSLLALLSVGYFYITDTRASIHRWFVVPSLRFLYKDPEEAHHYGTQALKFLYQFGLYPRERGSPGQEGDLTIEVRTPPYAGRTTLSLDRSLVKLSQTP